VLRQPLCYVIVFSIWRDAIDESDVIDILSTFEFH
jgi:hypothetical protein